MTASLIAVAAQICAFALGCAAIQAARAHAAIVTRLLAGIAMIVGAFVLAAAIVVWVPDDPAICDEITVCASLTGQQLMLEPPCGR